jgi:hypothetical protein
MMIDEVGVGAIGLVQPLLAIIDNVFGLGLGVEGLPPAHLRLNGGEHTGHAIGLQVGDNIDAVGQVIEAFERAAAFVIDQYKIEHGGVVSDSHRRDERDEQLDLPEPVLPATIPCTPSRLAEKTIVRGLLPDIIPILQRSQLAYLGLMLSCHLAQASASNSFTER